jgi:hypothetical protein
MGEERPVSTFILTVGTALSSTHIINSGYILK